MALPILVMGKSGTGKTTSLRNMKDTLIINVLNKSMPFKVEDQSLKQYACHEYLKIKRALEEAANKGYKKIVIDDSTYIMTIKFMEGHRAQKGNAIFELYNEIADSMYNLVQFVVNSLPQDVRVYFISHEQVDDYGNIKPKSIGKMLDEKIVYEGMFTIVIRSLKRDSDYVFATKTDGSDVTKTPIGLFEDEFIPNDLSIVDDKIKNYYNFQ